MNIAHKKYVALFGIHQLIMISFGNMAVLDLEMKFVFAGLIIGSLSFFLCGDCHDCFQHCHKNSMEPKIWF